MLAILAATSLALAQQTDTTLAVRQGMRLDVENFGGEILVRAWAQDRVRIQASHSSRDRIDVVAGASVIRVEAESRHGPAHLVEYQISLPAWMAVELSGVSTDVRVEGTRAAVRVETVEGEVTVTGGADDVSIQSVEGAVTVTGARARVEARSVDGDVRLVDIVGDVMAETVDGSVVIQNAQATDVDANTVDGDIYYIGTIRDGGRYILSTHDGTIAIGMPDGANAAVSVASFDGEFDASFPVQLRNATPGRRFSFTIGTGSARVELETFSGQVLLRRPGEVRVPATGSSGAPQGRNDESR